MRSANAEFEKSKRPGRKVVTNYRPEKCAECAGKGKRGRGKCKACKGKGTITKARATTTVERRNGDPTYLQVVIACVREIARLEGFGQKNRRSKAEVETDRHLHVHLDEQVARWRDAPIDLLLDAKCLADRLDAIRKPIRKAIDVKPVAEPV